MRFEWDPRKAESNFRKHGVEFELASAVFEDSLAVTVPNSIISGEERWNSIGLAFGQLIYVVFTSEESGGDEIVRIISARRATRQERRDYERGA